MIGRRDHSVQASIAELAHQRARVGLDDGDRNLRAIVAEAVQQRGRDGGGDLAGDAESDRPDQARLEIGSLARASSAAATTARARSRKARRRG